MMRTILVGPAGATAYAERAQRGRACGKPAIFRAPAGASAVTLRASWRSTALVLLGAAGLAAAADLPQTAADLGLQQGAPPPPERLVTVENFLAPPYNRWGLLHLRELVPTRAVRPAGRPSELPFRPVDLGDVEVDFPDGRRVRALDWLESAYTDGVIVLHDGAVVYERYFNGHRPDLQHLMFSVSKSVTGTLLLKLIDEGRVDEQARVGELVPELAGTAYREATVAQVLDMTNSIDYDEDYVDPDSDIAGYLQAVLPGGLGVYANLESLADTHPRYAHGEAFHYVTPDSEVLGWLVRRVTGETLAAALGRLLWQPMGAEYEASFWLDPAGTEVAGGGLAMTLRDAARFGLLILDDGEIDGRRVLPVAVAQRIRAARNADRFALLYEDPWYGGITDGYHDQWWDYAGVDAVAALGVFGQFIYVNAAAGVVIARQSSDPDAESQRVDGESALVMHAIARRLAAR